MRDKGKSVLSDAELVAILISSGSREESAVKLCKRILASVDNNLSELGKLSIKQLTEFKGIGEAKAISIIAALELGRRRRAGEALEKNKISSSSSVYELLQLIIGELPHEEFWILTLNRANHPIKKHFISKGGLSQTIVDVKLISKQALDDFANSIILFHNHPSGNLIPSELNDENRMMHRNISSPMCKSFEIQIYVDWFLSHIVASRRESTKDKRQSESNHIIYLIITGNISLQLSANAHLRHDLHVVFKLTSADLY